MKKLITILVLAAMLLTAFAAATYAETFIENPYCQAEFQIKKADPAYVKKDGVISAGEYEKVEIDKADLAINFISSGCYLTADAMADTMEYYFSWDEVNGLNFAVRYNAYPVEAGLAAGYLESDILDGCKTNVDQPEVIPELGFPKDNFLFNVGLNFASGYNKETKQCLFYYAIGKKTDGSSYLTGHWNQLGPDGVYEAVGGKDFEVSYNGTVVTIEWSIPFAEFGYEGATSGSQLEFTICATAGAANPEDHVDDAAFFNEGSTWTVSLGQKGGFLVKDARDGKLAKATLVADLIEAPKPEETTVVTTSAETTEAPTQEATTKVVTDIVTSEVTVTDDSGNVVTDDEGNAVTEVVSEVVTSIVTDEPTGNAGEGEVAPPTGSPMIIAAVVAAISACGIVVAKKRK